MKPQDIREAEQKVRAYKLQERKARVRMRSKNVEPVKRDRGRVKDNAHLQFIRRLPCVATYVQTGALVYGSDAAHVRFADAAAGKVFTGGQRKPDDAWTAPLSRQAHECQHSMNERAFWADLGVDVLDLCRRLYAASGDDAAGLAVIQSLRSEI